VAAYYGCNPLEVEQWESAQVHEWLQAANEIEEQKAKDFENQVSGRS